MTNGVEPKIKEYAFSSGVVGGMGVVEKVYCELLMDKAKKPLATI